MSPLKLGSLFLLVELKVLLGEPIGVIWGVFDVEPIGVTNGVLANAPWFSSESTPCNILYRLIACLMFSSCTWARESNRFPKPEKSHCSYSSLFDCDMY